MNKLIKEVEFGKYNFKVAINREIALKCAEEFPDFFADVLGMSGSGNRDIKTLIRQKKFRNMLEESDKIRYGFAEVVKFALPYMLQEAESTENADEIIQYAIDNDADDIFNTNLWEFILLGFTNNGEVKTPKVTFKMK